MTYLLDNAQPQTRDRFSCLERLYDPITTRTLTEVGTTEGWSCLEVGAGNGSIARWMSDQVGPDGHVVATDLDPRWVDLTGTTWPDNVDVAEHDVVHDDLPTDWFDLIHARLVLMHLPERDRVLAKLVNALSPGGFVVVEELDPVMPYVPDPTTDTDDLVNRVGDAFTLALSTSGADNSRGRSAHRILTDAGLVGVRNTGHLVVATDPDHPARVLMKANIIQTGPDLPGVSTQDIHRYVQAMDDPSVTFVMPAFFSAYGRRPVS